MSRNRVGGHKRKAWRLKKKYDKWFMNMLQEVARAALDEMPVELLSNMFDTQDYSVLRLFK